jgi:hypothetical protein
MTYRCTTIYFFWGLCLWCLQSVSPFSPVARISQRLLWNCSHFSLLKAGHPERLPDKVPVSPGLLPLSFFQSVRAKVPESGQCSYISGSYSVCSPFFHFRGDRPLHNVQSHIFRSLMEVLTICFVTSSSVVFQKVLLNVLLLPRCNHSFRPWFLMLLLYSGYARRLFPNITFFWGCFCKIVPAWSLMTVSLAQCRNGTVGHPSVGDSQLLLATTIALGPFLQLSGEPYD